MSSANSRGLSLGCQVVDYGSIEKAIERAIRAETAGFDTVTVPDHLFHPTGFEEYLVDPPREVFSILGAMAQRTEEVTLMSGVTDSVRRRPTELAHATTTFDRMTDGRAGFGTGAGGALSFALISDIDWDDPHTRFRECVAIIDGLWNSTIDEPFLPAGDYFDLDEAHMGPNPAQESRSPFWIGGYGESMRGLMGAVADGWPPWIYSPDEYAAGFRKVLDVAADRGRNPDAIDRAVMVPTTVSENGDEARAAGIERNRMNLALRPLLLADMGYEDIAESTSIMWQMAFDEEQERQLLAAARRIPDGAADDIRVAGDPERVIKRIGVSRDAGVDNLILIPVGDYEETMRHYENETIPYFSER